MQPGRWSKKIFKSADAKKTLRAGPAENFRRHNYPASDAEFGLLRNAVGISLDKRAGPKGTGISRDPAAAIDVAAKNVAGAKIARMWVEGT
jgi:hypothetical protein